MTRRTLLTVGGAALAGTVCSEPDVKPVARGMSLVQEPLLFNFEALEPFIDARTMKIHYEQHHATYLKALRETLIGIDLQVANTASLMSFIKNMENLPARHSMMELKQHGRISDAASESIRNNGGGHFNHTAFWRFLTPSGGQGPEGRVAAAIQLEFGSIDEFKKVFTEAALSRFGSGWVWLIYRADGKLVVTSTANQDNPLMKGIVPDAEVGRPLLCLDVWEHAYYLKHNGNRAAYIADWWNVVNWPYVARAHSIVTARA